MSLCKAIVLDGYGLCWCQPWLCMKMALRWLVLPVVDVPLFGRPLFHFGLISHPLGENTVANFVLIVIYFEGSWILEFNLFTILLTVLTSKWLWMARHWSSFNSQFRYQLLPTLIVSFVDVPASLCSGFIIVAWLVFAGEIAKYQSKVPVTDIWYLTKLFKKRWSKAYMYLGPVQNYHELGTSWCAVW